VTDRRILAIAGGVGGAKLAHGLQLALPDPTRLSVIINTADDFELYGLHISPDIDTVTYTLSGLANPATGWGVRDDTRQALDMIARYGEDPWFQLGDRDFATHILRTQRLREGQTLTRITREMSAALGIPAELIPMTDAPVATLIDTPDGRLDFQQYFVAHRHADEVTGVTFAGIEAATPSPAALSALGQAEAVIFCPSNPIVSIGPILSVPGLRDAIAEAPGPKVVVSPIVGGQALKGPAAEMLQTLGHEVSSLGVARLYTGLAQGLVIDRVDEAFAPAIEAEGMLVLVTNTIMQNDDDREALARETLDFAGRIALAQVND
jgi:LPPG:FO 2-phospho-L-lactate transferase